MDARLVWIGMAGYFGIEQLVVVEAEEGSSTAVPLAMLVAHAEDLTRWGTTMYCTCVGTYIHQASPGPVVRGSLSRD